jgi:hypothetical protein
MWKTGCRAREVVTLKGTRNAMWIVLQRFIHEDRGNHESYLPRSPERPDILYQRHAMLVCTPTEKNQLPNQLAGALDKPASSGWQGNRTNGAGTPI